MAGDKSFWKVLVARSDAGAARRIDDVFEIVGLSTAASPRRTLSHGQKQWLEIGMLLMQDPELLLVDEPVAGMTPQETQRTAELLVSLAGEHSVVVVEHDMDFVRSIARRVTVLHEGRVLAEGRHGPRAERSAGDRGVSRGMSVLQIKALNQSYGGSHTLWDVDLPCRPDSRTCLMGRNGMGKTTLLKCIMGLLPATSGGLAFGDTDLRRMPAERARPAGHRLRSAGAGNLSAAHRGGKPADRARRSKEWRSAAMPPKIFDLFPVLETMRHRRGGDLSGGQQQQLAIGRALVLEPSLLILDEPTEGIQPNIVHEIGDIILKLNEETGLTVLLVEQKLPFARRVASDFRILEKGRCVSGGPIGELTDDIVRAHLSV